VFLAFKDLMVSSMHTSRLCSVLERGRGRDLGIKTAWSRILIQQAE